MPESTRLQLDLRAGPPGRLTGPRITRLRRGERQVESEIDQQVLLAADKLAASGLQQQRAHVDAILAGGSFRVTEETGVDAGETEGQRLPIDPHRPVLQRPHQVVRSILQREQVAPVLPSVQGGGCGERLQRTVAGSCAVPGERRVHPKGARLDRSQLQTQLAQNDAATARADAAIAQGQSQIEQTQAQLAWATSDFDRARNSPRCRDNSAV